MRRDRYFKSYVLKAALQAIEQPEPLNQIKSDHYLPREPPKSRRI